MAKIVFDHLFTHIILIFHNLRNVLQNNFAQICWNLSQNYQEGFALRFCSNFFESFMNTSQCFSIQFCPKVFEFVTNLSGMLWNTILHNFLIYQICFSTRLISIVSKPIIIVVVVIDVVVTFKVWSKMSQ